MPALDKRLTAFSGRVSPLVRENVSGAGGSSVIAEGAMLTGYSGKSGNRKE